MPTPIALQLYTLRDRLADDFAGTIRKVAAMGYVGVETAFFPDGVTPGAARAIIADAGLTVCSAHAPLPLGEGRDEALALARDLDCSTLVWHGWPEDPRYATADGVSELIAEYNAAARVAADHGIRLGLHNHWWEFRRIDGACTFDRLTTECDPRIFFELDTYWATVAGDDPAGRLRQLQGRAPLVHVKDGPGVADALKQPVGDGALPIAEIVAAASAQWLIVELDDCAGDMLEAVARSHAFLTERGLAAGR